IILPDSCILIHYMLDKTCSLIENLVVFPENMQKNLELTKGLVFSQALLLHLVQSGLTRENAYSLVQQEAMKSRETSSNFLDNVLANKEITSALAESKIRDIFSYERYLRNVDFIYRRCGIL
ncbi:MAG TPA: adenylosuccinate lyase, partial [Candidatus Cloacimonas sp.]|nr:adenylosuccinate lyase [Candidatus Cloacimonas sp.]